MDYTLSYKVIHSQIVTVVRSTVVDGNEGDFSYPRAVVEAELDNGGGKTLTVELDPSAADNISEGDTITVTITKAS